MATPSRALLDLVTDHESQTVRINHVDYILRAPTDLTLAEYRELERISPRLGMLLLLEQFAPAEERELAQLLDRACRIAVAAPDVVHNALGDVQRIQIFDAFMTRLSPSLPAASARRTETVRSRGRKRSRSSSGSTAARRTAGRGRRPSA